MTPSPSKNTACFILFILTAGLLLYLLISGIDKAVDPVTLLPHDTAVLIDLKKPVAGMNKFRRSKLGIRINSIEWPEILGDIGLPEHDVRSFQAAARKLDGIIKNPFFTELFGKRVLLGLMPADRAYPALIQGQTGIDRMAVLIARPRHGASLVGFFADFFLDELEYTSESYKGREVKTYDYEGRFTFSATVTDGLIVASFSTDLVKRCIDNAISNMTTGLSGLQDNIHYRQLRRRARGRDDQFIYVDVLRLQILIEELRHGGGFPPHSGYHGGLVYTTEPSVQRIAFFRQPGPRPRVMNYSSIVQSNRDAEQFHHPVFIWHKPVRDSILAVLPDNNVIHLWLNIFNCERFWNFLRSRHNIYAMAFVQGIEKIIADRTGQTVDDFFSSFGSQISVNVAEIKSSTVFPMPRVSVFLEVRDREKLRNLLKSLCTGLPVRHTLIAGREIYSIMLAGGLMQPSFMFHDDFLVVADNRKQLESLSSRQKNPLLKNPLFKKVDTGLTEANNIVLYYRNAELIDSLKEMIVGYGSLLHMLDGESEAKNRVILEKIVLPVLDGMKMYTVKTVRAYSREKEMIIRSSQLLEKN